MVRATATRDTLSVVSISARLGKAVRVRREAVGLSQEALAELAGISRTYLGEVERGTATPSVETVHKLAVGLGVELCALFQECEDTE